MPVILPGFVFYTLVHGNYEKAAVLSLVLIIALFHFYKLLNIFVKAKGFIKRFIWSFILVNASMVISSYAPEAKNAFAGAVLFLFVPSMLIANSMLTNSKPAHRVVMLCKKGL